MFSTLTHNQGVPGSCPGGPTLIYSHLHLIVGGFFYLAPELTPDLLRLILILRILAI
jgi:hypothetical protein